ELHARVDGLVHQVGEKRENHGGNGDVDGDRLEQRKVAPLDREDHFAADARNREKALDQKGADKQSRKLCHDVGDDRNRSVAQYMHPHDPVFGQSLGARRADVVGVDLVEHKSAEEPQVGRDADDEPDEYGKRRIHHEVLPEAVAPALHREPTKLIGEEVLEDDDVDEYRYRQADGADDHHRAVGQRASYISDAQRQADRHQRADDQKPNQHRQRRAQTRRHDARDRLIGAPARAEVTREHLLDENSQLYDIGLIDTELPADVF